MIRGFLVPMKLILISGIVLFCLCFFWRIGSADTITVDDNSGADYVKIQDAIDNAMDGDTIRVYEGTYYENVVVDKTVSLLGNGSDVTTINGSGSRDLVKITADWVNMSGFTVTGRGGYGTSENTSINVFSNHNIISNNNCSNWFNGIKLHSSNNNTIKNNTFRNNFYQGIGLKSSSDCIITSNTIDNSFMGIVLSSSSGCIILNNSMKETGLHIEGRLENWNSHFIDDTNTINEKPLIYIKNNSGLIIPQGAGQVILANCTWMNVENQSCSNGSIGILVGYSSNITIENNTCENNWYSIILDRSSTCTITNNICSSRNYMGIFIFDSNLITIITNTISGNAIGIFLGTSSDDNTVYYTFINNNTISGNQVGIRLQSSSLNTTIHYNNFYNNTTHGIFSLNYGKPIDARYNWWGVASGPYHPTKNSRGDGDKVYDDVLFDPWFDEHGNLVYPSDKPDYHDDEPSRNPLYFLLILLAGLFTALVFVIHTTKTSFNNRPLK